MQSQLSKLDRFVIVTPTARKIPLESALPIVSHLPEFRKNDVMPGSEDIVSRKLIPATELAEFVYCAKAWELKYVQKAESSAEARQLQTDGNAWHEVQGQQLARSDRFRRAAFVVLALAVMLFLLVWMGWLQ